MRHLRHVRLLSLGLVLACLAGAAAQERPTAPVKPVITVVHAGRLVDVVAGVVRPRQDPIQDISVLEKMAFVMKDGRVIVRGR